MSVMSGFKEFIARGNVIDLAVAVVMGTALTAVVNSIVDSLINPLIAAVFQAPNLEQAGQFTIGVATFYPGAVLGAIVKFLIVAVAVYFFVVLPITKMTNRFAKRRDDADDADDAASVEVQLLTEIRDLLKDERRSSWPYAGGN